MNDFVTAKKNIVVDIAIPVFNEEDTIRECIASVLSFKKKENIKVNIFVIDGGSTDKTLEIIKSNFQDLADIKILTNPKKISSSAMNIAISEGKGDYLLRLDAHSYYPIDYLEICLTTALETDADNVGGLVATIPGAETYSALLVQSLTTHWFGVGDSGFRIGAEAGPRDTVPYGFFKKSIFNKVGQYDERLVRAQDYELNTRIIKYGGLVWLNPKILLTYKNQASLYNFYHKQITLEAPYNSYMWWIERDTFNFRHSITGFFSFGFIAGCILSPFSKLIFYPFIFIMALYLFLSLYASFQQAIRFKKFAHIFSLPACFFLFHFLHGLGVLKGCMLLLANKAPVQNIQS
ncbi:glycosyltransferase [Gammaproteobacteria bacterium]|nr:glycosyltransferase [Gammaproteobacteria bacterium]